MDFDKYNIGFGITGSFCTFAKARKAVEHLCEMGGVHLDKDTTPFPR